jgi:hypothetical protein
MAGAQAKSFVTDNSPVENSVEASPPAAAETPPTRRNSLREILYTIGFLGAALIATGGWLWLLSWIVITIL